MRILPLHRLFTLAALACALPGAPAGAGPGPGSPWSWALGFSTCKLRPAHGSDQVLNGFALAGEYRLDPRWSLEAAFSHETGTEAGGVNLRQNGFLAGARYTLARSGPWLGYAHLLAGRKQLQASEPGAQDQRTSLAFSPGAGLEYQAGRHLAVRAQADFILTHYAGVHQRSPGLVLALAYRP
jgi:hypothetical protein